eukprot:jgi/Ulvmu1/9722/UM055_0061.1
MQISLMPNVRWSSALRANAVDWLRRSEDSGGDAGDKPARCSCASASCGKRANLCRSSGETFLASDSTEKTDSPNASEFLQTFVGGMHGVGSDTGARHCALDGRCTGDAPMDAQPSAMANAQPVRRLSLDGPPAAAPACSCPLVCPGGPPAGDCPHMPQACSSLDPNDLAVFVRPVVCQFQQPFTSEPRWRLLAASIKHTSESNLYRSGFHQRPPLSTVHSPVVSSAGEQPCDRVEGDLRRLSSNCAKYAKIPLMGGEQERCGKCFACAQAAPMAWQADSGKRDIQCLRTISKRAKRSDAEAVPSQVPNCASRKEMAPAFNKVTAACGKLIRRVLCHGSDA